GLGHGFEAFINADFFQQVTSRQPFLLSGPGFSIPRLLGLPTIAFFGPPVTGSGGAAFFPGSFSPRGGILPALSSPFTWINSGESAVAGLFQRCSVRSRIKAYRSEQSGQ